MPHVLIKFRSFEDWLLIVWGDRWIEEEKHSHKKRATRPPPTFPKDTLTHTPSHSFTHTYTHTHTTSPPPSSPFRSQSQRWKWSCTHSHVNDKTVASWVGQKSPTEEAQRRLGRDDGTAAFKHGGFFLNPTVQARTRLHVLFDINNRLGNASEPACFQQISDAKYQTFQGRNNTAQC